MRDRQTDRHRETDRQTDRHRETDRHRDKEREMGHDNEPLTFKYERQTDRQTDTETKRERWDTFFFQDGEAESKKKGIPLIHISNLKESSI